MTVNQLTKTRSKSTITQEIVDALTSLIAAGNYNNTAASIVGISEGTFYNWMEQGRKDEESGIESLYLQLLQSTKRAEAHAEAEMVARVRAAANPGIKKKVIKTDSKGNVTEEIHETGGDWLAAATHLERRHPERWGRKDRTRVDINERKSITITHVEVVLNQGGTAPPVIEGESRELKEGE